MNSLIEKKSVSRKKPSVRTAGVFAVIASLVVVVLGPLFIRAQSVPIQSAASFDVASIRKVRPLQTRSGPWIQTSPGSVTIRNGALLWCIGWAYDQKEDLIAGPDWVTDERYDVLAKAAGSAAEAQLKFMLRALLADRFKLVIHREQTQQQVYVLVVGKNGPKIHAAQDGAAGYIGPAGNGLSFKGTSILRFADFLSNLEPIGRPVLDRSGLTGLFDFTLTLSENQLDPSSSGGKEAVRRWPSIFTDIQEQLGLKLESTKGPVDTLIIDHVERPTEN
jgi:uncharacterized protein (TIGR03435 family)